MRRGFTLIEMMIVIALLGVFIGSTMTDAFFFLRQPPRLTARLEATARDARVLELLGRDLREARGMLDDPRRPDRLILQGATGRVLYYQDASRCLVRAEVPTRGPAPEPRVLTPPLEDFRFEPATFRMRGSGAQEESADVIWQLSTTRYPGVRVTLRGGCGLLSRGETLTVAWRGERP